MLLNRLRSLLERSYSVFLLYSFMRKYLVWFFVRLFFCLVLVPDYSLNMYMGLCWCLVSRLFPGYYSDRFRRCPGNNAVHIRCIFCALYDVGHFLWPKCRLKDTLISIVSQTGIPENEIGQCNVLTAEEIPCPGVHRPRPLTTCLSGNRIPFSPKTAFFLWLVFETFPRNGYRLSEP